MGTAFLSLVLFLVCLSSLKSPWIGVASYYFLALLGPQYIWWWVFEGIRVSFFVAFFTLSGLALNIFLGKLDLSFLKTKQIFWMSSLWFFVVLSYFCGPYISIANEVPGLNPQTLFPIANKTFIFFFCGALIIDGFKKIKWFSFVFLITGICLICWANLQYFNANWIQFNAGRLMGPKSLLGGTIYNDENNFAMIFVTSLPFIFYFGLWAKNTIVRYSLWAFIPFGIHAVFLTGSRGGLLGIGVITLLGTLRSNKKVYAILLLLILFCFYQWQAGDVMKDRSETISDYQGESSAEDRLNAWMGGLNMIASHPITGVGISSFHVALPDFIESRPMVAHNTLIQFSAESGLGAGLSYCFLIFISFFNFLHISKWCQENDKHQFINLVDNLNHASAISFAGLIVCSCFLSLNYFEIFFFLIIINNSLRVLCAE